MAASAVFLRDSLPPPAAGSPARMEGRQALARRQDPGGQPAGPERLRRHARAVLDGGRYHLVLIVALSLTATAWVPLAAVFPGALVVAAFAWGQRALCRRILRTSRALPQGGWQLGLVLADFVQGLGWLVFALPFWRAGVPAGAEAFLVTAAILLSIAAALTRSELMAAVWAALAPLALVTVLAGACGTGETSAALALLGLSAQGSLACAAIGLNGASAEAWRNRVRLRARTAALRRLRARSGAARRRARESDRSTAQLFATMGHELRTPLNAILGFSEVMKNEVLGSHSTPSYREYSKHIHGSGQHLLALINEILDLSRIESGQYRLQEETADLKQLVRESLEAAVATAEAKTHAVALEAAADLDPIRVDPAAVRQAVVNLISNAIKFTPAGRRIVLRVGWTSRGGQYVSVADEGPGIPPEEIGVALSSFGRGSLAVAAAEQGVGLGLPIARGLMELHGGRLLLRSRVGQGTEAVLIFPAERRRSARAVRPAA